jgi:gamma-glutamyltranspeptidase/glutathione hydrolase
MEKYQVRAIYSGIHFSRNVQKNCKRGRDEFYKGEIAKLSLVLLRNKAVFLAMKILRITTEWVDPVSTNYRGYDVWELPPNGQGWQRYKCLI